MSTINNRTHAVNPTERLPATTVRAPRMQHSQPLQADSCESRLVADIINRPQDRSAYVALAEYLEKTGQADDSRAVYRGNLPVSIQERHDLNPYPHSTSRRMDSCQRLARYEQERLSLRPPLNEDSKRNSVFLAREIQTAEEHVDLMQDCTLIYDGRNRLYLDRHGVRNSNHSTMNAWLLTPRAEDTSAATRLQGLCLMLAARNSHNFYHWHFDCLPALGLIEAAGIPLESIDHLLVDQNDRGFQVQMLEAAGIRKDQIRFIDVRNCHLHCEQMLLVRVQNQQGMAQSRRHLDWIRRTFLSLAVNNAGQHGKGPERLAIKRDVRGFTNADAVYAHLEKRGYSCIQPETLSYAQQVTLFAGATHVLAPHGAGLSLLAYCRPETRVHEFHGDHVQPCFWSISSTLGLDYHNYNCSQITAGETTRSNKNLSERLARSIPLSPDFLQSLQI